MPVETLKKSLAERLKAARSDADKQLSALVLKAAEGKEVDPDAVLETCERAGIDAEEFLRRVAAKEQRITAQKRLKEVPGKQARLEALRADIAAKEAEAEKVLAALEDAMRGPRYEAKRLAEDLADSSMLKMELLRSCDAPEIVAELRDINKALDDNAAETGRIERERRDVQTVADKNPRDEKVDYRPAIEKATRRVAELTAELDRLRVEKNELIRRRDELESKAVFA
jgi:hypothetical protein